MGTFFLIAQQGGLCGSRWGPALWTLEASAASSSWGTHVPGSALQSSLEQSGPSALWEAIKRHSTYFNRRSCSGNHFGFLLLYSSLAFFFFKETWTHFLILYWLCCFTCWVLVCSIYYYLFAFYVIEYFDVVTFSPQTDMFLNQWKNLAAGTVWFWNSNMEFLHWVMCS